MQTFWAEAERTRRDLRDREAGGFCPGHDRAGYSTSTAFGGLLKSHTRAQANPSL